MNVDLARWLLQLRKLSESLSGVARLTSYEPYLRACITLDNGSGSLAVSITPDHLRQQHRFEFDFDQSYLSCVILQLERVLERFPTDGTQ